MTESVFEVEVDGGAVPLHAPGEERQDLSGLVVVPSIFGPTPDLLESIASLNDVAFSVIMDPFWRAGGGAIPYRERQCAIERLRGFELQRCFVEARSVVEWVRPRCNGRVIGLGICFGGPVVLDLAASGALAGLVTWHGSRMDQFLDRVQEIDCPIRMQFGGADPMTPSETIANIESACSGSTDVRFVVHPGLDHGYTLRGEHFDAEALAVDLGVTRELLRRAADIG